MHSSPGNRRDYLHALLERRRRTVPDDPRFHLPRTLVFVKSRRQCDALAVDLIKHNYRCLAINGGHPMKLRKKTVSKEREKKNSEGRRMKNIIVG